MTFKYLTTISVINFDKITDIFCIVDEFCTEFEKFTQPFLIGNPPKRKPKMSNSEIMTIVILFQLSGFRTPDSASILLVPTKKIIPKTTS